MLDLEIDGRSNGSRLVIRQHLNETQPIGRKVVGSTIYMSTERDIIYREDVEVDGTITTYGLVRDHDVLEYFNGRGGVLELPVDEGAITMEEPLPDFIPKPNLPEINQTKFRRPRALLDDLGTPAVAKLLVFVDKQLFKSFLPINANNGDLAEADIRNFFTLIGNEMTIMYQSLKQYDNVYYRDGKTSFPQNIAIQIVHVIFPPSQNDFGFVTNNVNNSVLFNTTIREFATFIATYTPPVSYDHAVLVTGYVYQNLDGEKLAGNAYPGTMCSKRYYGYHTSVIELAADIVSTMAHELGHGFGMSHDGANGCTDRTYIMADSALQGTLDNAATYRTFSQCSSNELETHTKQLSGSLSAQGDFRTTCLLPPTATFNASFCLGFTGQFHTLDEQCKLVYGASSRRCKMPETHIESNLLNGFVANCVSNGNISPFYCTWKNNGRCEPIFEVMMGTNCVLNNEEDPNNRCYQGECQNVTVCGACNFEEDLCGWSQDTSSQFDWVRHSGASDVADKTGPTGDRHGTTTGFYMLADASKHEHKQTKLLSPNIPVESGNHTICFSFYYMMFGKDMGTVRLRMSYLGPNQNATKIIWKKTGSQKAEWIKQEIQVKDSFLGGTINFEFIVKIGKGYLSDIALDDINIKEGNC